VNESGEWEPARKEADTGPWSIPRGPHRSLRGTCTKTGPLEWNGAYKRSRLRSLPKRRTAILLSFSHSLLFHASPHLPVPFLRRTPLSKTIESSVFVRPPPYTHTCARASVCSRPESFSRHPLIKFRNRSSLLPSSLSALSRANRPPRDIDPPASFPLSLPRKRWHFPLARTLPDSVTEFPRRPTAGSLAARGSKFDNVAR